MNPEIIFEKKKNDYTIATCKIPGNYLNEYLTIKQLLSKQEIETFETIKNEKRKKEWIGARVLLTYILGRYEEIFYDINGKPFLNSGKNISISHSGNAVSVIVSEKKGAATDLQEFSTKLTNISDKFMTYEEINYFTGKDKSNFIWANWCAKETVFKSISTGNIDFRKDIKVFKQKIVNNGILKVKYRPEKKIYNLNYEFISDNYLIIWYKGE